MTSKQRFCMKCGAGLADGFHFCSKCGAPAPPPKSDQAPAEDKGRHIQPSPQKKVQDAVKAAQTISSAAGKVSATVQQAASLIDKVEAVASAGASIAPPPKWTVVVGDILPKFGEAVVDAAVQKGVQHIQQQAASVVSRQVERAVSKAFTAPEPPEPSGVEKPDHCPKCNTELKENARFCGKCGFRIEALPAPPPEPPKADRCPKCSKELKENARFCGKCGFRIEDPPAPPPEPPKAEG
ncbi:MAG: zinc-ribbon domain-containing protein [Candidatus Xenobiia bacterium LiM19]